MDENGERGDGGWELLCEALRGRGLSTDGVDVREVWEVWGPHVEVCCWVFEALQAGDDVESALRSQELWVERGWVSFAWLDRGAAARREALAVWGAWVREGALVDDAWMERGAVVLEEAGWLVRDVQGRRVVCSSGLGLAFGAAWVAARLEDDVFADVAERWESSGVVLEGDVLEDLRAWSHASGRALSSVERGVLLRSLDALLKRRTEAVQEARKEAEVQEHRLEMEDVRWEAVREKARADDLEGSRRRWVWGAAVVGGVLVCALGVVLWGEMRVAQVREELRVQGLALDGAKTRASQEERRVRDVQSRINRERGKRAQALASLPGREFESLGVGIEAVGSSFLEGGRGEEEARLGLFEGLRATEGLVTFQNHAGVVRSVEFSPDGSRLVSAGYDTTARVWDPETGQEFGVFRGHTDWVNAAQWSRDGRRVVTASFDGTLGVWDVGSGERRCTLVGPGDFMLNAAFSEDDAAVVGVGFDARVGVWDARTCAWLGWLHGHEDVVKRIEFAPKGSLFATVSDDGTARVWDVASRTQHAVLRGHTGWVFGARWSPDGQTLATVGRDGTVRFWNTTTWEPVAVLRGHSGPVLDLAFSPDGTMLASAGKDGIVGLWDVQKRTGLKMFRGHGGVLASVRWNADSTKIAVAGQEGTARVWDVRHSRVVRTLPGHTGWILAVRFNTQGDRVVTAGEHGDARVWTVRSQREVCVWEKHAGAVSVLSVSRDGTQVVSAGRDGNAYVWNVPKAQTCSPEPVATLRHDGAEILSAQFTGRSSGLITSASDGSAKMWDVGTGQEVAAFVEPKSGWVLTASFNPQDTQVVTAGERGWLRVWNVDGTQRTPLEGHRGAVRVAEWSADGSKLITAGEDTVARIWSRDPNGRWRTETVLSGHTGWVVDARFVSQDQNHYVVTTGQDGTLRVWDAATGRLVQMWDAHQGGVLSLDVSEEGDMFLTTGNDAAARLWTLGNPDGRTLSGHLGAVTAGRFAPDSPLLATTGADGTLQIWDRRTARRHATLRGHLSGGLELVWLPGGRVVTSSKDATVRLWDLGGLRDSGDSRAMLQEACARFRYRTAPQETHGICDRVLRGTNQATGP